jgi:hypothetical protein
MTREEVIAGLLFTYPPGDARHSEIQALANDANAHTAGVRAIELGRWQGWAQEMLGDQKNTMYRGRVRDDDTARNQLSMPIKEFLQAQTDNIKNKENRHELIRWRKWATELIGTEGLDQCKAASDGGYNEYPDGSVREMIGTNRQEWIDVASKIGTEP